MLTTESSSLKNELTKAEKEEEFFILNEDIEWIVHNIIISKARVKLSEDSIASKEYKIME